MVSLFNVSLIGFFLFFIIVVQAKPLLESSNTSEENKPSKNKQQLYALYKTMREDPRLASVSNNDLVLFIYRNYVYGINDDVDSIQQKYPTQQRTEEEKAN